MDVWSMGILGLTIANGVEPFINQGEEED